MIYEARSSLAAVQKVSMTTSRVFYFGILVHLLGFTKYRSRFGVLLHADWDNWDT